MLNISSFYVLLPYLDVFFFHNLHCMFYQGARVEKQSIAYESTLYKYVLK